MIKMFEEFSKEKPVRKWKIFAGLGGGFGGARYKRTVSCTEEEAERHAYLDACEEYESHEGTQGIRAVDEIMDEEGCGEVEAQEIYNEERESWLDYHVKPADGGAAE